MLQCPFCQKPLSDALDCLERTCPSCGKDVYMEIEQNFRKVMEFGGEFIRLNHQNKSHPFLKAYRAGGRKDFEFFFEKGSEVCAGDTIELDSSLYRITQVLPFFNPQFHIAEKAAMEIVKR